MDPSKRTKEALLGMPFLSSPSSSSSSCEGFVQHLKSLTQYALRLDSLSRLNKTTALGV